MRRACRRMALISKIHTYGVNFIRRPKLGSFRCSAANVNMDYLAEAFTAFREYFVEFIKVRQLNFAVAALVTCGYMAYQFWHKLFDVKPAPLVDSPPHHEEKADASRCDHNRSRSKSRSSYSNKVARKSRARYDYD
ncbi:hypothetical protein O0L34_g521 [Tuta absoluta]|nr:hypothetical protein O0L34_g521 [Tuta absoluta]